MPRYLIIGGTGSLGKKLIERLVTTSTVFVYSRDEAKHWTLRNELKQKYDLAHLECLVGDVRDVGRLRDVIRQVKPTTIIIAAALKQVDTCELSPNESVLTNLVGTQNVVTAVADVASPTLESVLFVSTDKACSPVNVYGMCKAVSERVVTSQARTGIPHVRYLAVRYGNVLESRGSIIPLFKYQSEHADHLTVTDPNMTRFVMTLDDSVDLILCALEQGLSGETWIPKLSAMRIGDLAELFSERSGKPVKVVGLRPGEKMHEDLINQSESVRTRHNPDHYVIAPAFMQGNQESFQYQYTSADSVMTKDELASHLQRLGVMDMSLNQFTGRSIEEIVR